MNPKNYNTNVFSRNLGLLSHSDQEKLAQTTVTIAGVGGDGGLLAERLVRIGIGHLILADPDVFESSNINRQFGANSLSIGQNKATAVGNELVRINPNLEITTYTKGITAQNVKVIAQASDVIVDEIEYRLPSISVMLHQTARKLHKPIFMGANIGWGASLYFFDPSGITFEKFFEYDVQSNAINPFAYFPERPSYINKELLADIISGKKEVPGVSSSVSLVASAITVDITLFITGKKVPVKVPDYRFIDLHEFTMKTFTKTNSHENSSNGRNPVPDRLHT